MNSPSAFVLACLFCTFAASADEVASADPVATISMVEGQVLLTRGTRIGPAIEGAVLSAGDRLMTLDHSNALIAFADGCEQRLDGDTLLTIGESSDCVSGKPLAMSFHQAIGESGAGADDDDKKKAVAVIDASNASGATSSSLTTGQRWGVAAALLIPIIYYWDRNRDDNDRPPVSR